MAIFTTYLFYLAVIAVPVGILSTALVGLIRRYQDRHPSRFESSERLYAYAGPVPGDAHQHAEPERQHQYAAHHD